MKRLIARLSSWRNRRVEQARQEAYTQAYEDINRSQYQGLVKTHGPGVWACLNGDAALFMSSPQRRTHPLSRDPRDEALTHLAKINQLRKEAV